MTHISDQQNEVKKEQFPQEKEFTRKLATLLLKQVQSELLAKKQSKERVAQKGLA